MKSTFLAVLGFACVSLPSAPAAEATAEARAAAPESVPCKILEGTKPQFPLRMLKQGVSTGTVRVLLYVDAEGRLADSLVTAYTRRAFADEVLRAIGKWKFEPGRTNGRPADTVVDLTLNFHVNEVLLVQRFGNDDTSAPETVAGYEYQACNLQKLDRLPTPLSVIEPTYPQEWLKQGVVGSVAVDFYIDESGKARFATVKPGTNEQLAGIAVAAVQQWRFNPPTSKGKPVLVRVRQVFAFGKD